MLVQVICQELHAGSGADTGGGSGGPGPPRRADGGGRAPSVVDFGGGPKIVRGDPYVAGGVREVGAKGGEYVPEGPKLQIFFALRAIKTSEIAPNLTEGGANVPKNMQIFSRFARYYP